MDNAQNAYFTQAYKTGTDFWSSHNFFEYVTQLLTHLPQNAFILDVGIGRGRMIPAIVERGFRVIGIDVIEDIVIKVNEEIKNHGIEKNARAIVASVLNIPFTDESFDAIIDIGLAQHLSHEEQEQYAKQVLRVLRKGGYILSVQLARETQKYLTWFPKSSETGIFERDGVAHVFFTEEEQSTLYADAKIISKELVPLDAQKEVCVCVLVLQK